MNAAALKVARLNALLAAAAAADTPATETPPPTRLEEPLLPAPEPAAEPKAIAVIGGPLPPGGYLDARCVRCRGNIIWTVTINRPRAYASCLHCGQETLRWRNQPGGLLAIHLPGQTETLPEPTPKAVASETETEGAPRNPFMPPDPTEPSNGSRPAETLAPGFRLDKVVSGIEKRTKQGKKVQNMELLRLAMAGPEAWAEAFGMVESINAEGDQNKPAPSRNGSRRNGHRKKKTDQPAPITTIRATPAFQPALAL